MFGRRVVATTCISGRYTQPGVLPTIQGANRSQFFSTANRRTGPWRKDQGEGYTSRHTGFIGEGASHPPTLLPAPCTLNPCTAPCFLHRDGVDGDTREMVSFKKVGGGWLIHFGTKEDLIPAPWGAVPASPASRRVVGLETGKA